LGTGVEQNTEKNAIGLLDGEEEIDGSLRFVIPNIAWRERESAFIRMISVSRQTVHHDRPTDEILVHSREDLFTRGCVSAFHEHIQC
jgi:hypothetical protein